MILTGSTALIVENKALRARIEQLEAELQASRALALEEAAKVVKVAWLKYPLSNIADADVLCELCEETSAAILALIPSEDRPPEDPDPPKCSGEPATGCRTP